MANDTKNAPDVKDVPEKVPDKQASSQVGLAPEQPAPTADKPAPAKPVSSEQVKTAAQEAPVTPGKTEKAPEPPGAGQPDKDAVLLKEQAALRAEMEAQEAFHEKSSPRKAPAVKKQPATQQKKPPTEKEAPEKKVDRAAIEKELREMYGIPKSEKPVAAWVPPKRKRWKNWPFKKVPSDNRAVMIKAQPQRVRVMVAVIFMAVTSVLKDEFIIP